jgi:DNA ligase (NAD+)
MDQTIEQLRDQINYHDRQYYVLDAPEITDQQYDLLFKQLKNLEAAHPKSITPDSPTQRVGGSTLKGFTKVHHDIPMLGIANTDSFKLLRNFEIRGSKLSYIIENKIDGVAISLRYENGLLTQALTRGNGDTGSDITTNVRTIKSIPLRLTTDSPPELLEVRGEIFLTDAQFGRINQQRKANKKSAFANPRNLAAGTLKLFDPKTVASRCLSFIAHSLAWPSDFAANQNQTLQKLATLGLPIDSGYKITDNFDRVIEICQKRTETRSSLPYQIDGLVIKLNDITDQYLMGDNSARSPLWCIAYKFPSPPAETTIETITIQTGKTGKQTPIAILKPIQMGDTMVRRANLHNFNGIFKELRQGDTVIIKKAGGLIPQIVNIDKTKRLPNAKPFEIPKQITN